MTKNLKQTLLGMALAAGCLSAAASAHALPGAQTIYANVAAWGAWGPIIQSDDFWGGPNKVRGQLSRRHARDRVFYNTTSNSGPYIRSLYVECTNQVFQFNSNRYTTDSDGDLTLFCNSGNQLINEGGTSKVEINSLPF